MNLKNWPYWLKGGIIGFILPFIYVIINGLILILTKGKCSVGCIAVVGVECPPSIYNCFYSTIQIYPLSLLLIGALIGHIYGRIKK